MFGFQDGKLLEVVSGWSQLAFKDMFQIKRGTKKFELPIKGGNVISQGDISTQDIRAKRQGWKKFTQMIKGKVKSRLTVMVDRNVKSTDQCITTS